MRFPLSLLLLSVAALEAAQLPVAFEENRGQADPSVRYLRRSGDHTLFLTAHQAVLAGSGGASQVRFVNASPGVRIDGEEQTAGNVNYLIGNNPRAWRTNVRTYRSVRYLGLYRGIDLLFYGNEYDFIVAAGADPSAIMLDFGATPRIQASGDLVLKLPAGSTRHHKPAAYQGNKAIAVNFIRKSGGRIGFEVGSYNHSLPLTIDPVLTYSTYLGGGDHDAAFSVTTDRSGNIYLAGMTASSNFPKTLGTVPERIFPNATDAFVAKLNPEGTALVYATYLGGSDSESAMAIAVDSGGNAYVTGGTNSRDFPITPGALQTRFGGTGGHSLPPFSMPVGDAFVVKLNPTGSALAYSSYLGGTGIDQGYGVAVNSSGEAYVAGSTESNLPATPGAFQSRPGGAADIFVAKLNQAGTGLVYLTFLGGSGEDHALALALDSSGNIYLTGVTGSSDFPLTPGAFESRPRGRYDAYVAKLNSAGTTLLYSTYLGGNNSTYGFGIAVDSGGSAYVTGATSSTDFPQTPGAFQFPAGAGSQGGDVFLTKFSPLGNTLVYSSVFGGTGADFGAAIAVDNAGNASIAGRTYSNPLPASNFPTTPNAIQRCGGGSTSAFVSRFNGDGSAMEYSSFLSGLDGDSSAAAIAIDASGRILVAGSTDARDFPVTSGALQAAFAGGSRGFDSDNLIPFGGDAFVTKVDLSAPSPMRISCIANSASYSANLVSPGELVTFFGSGLGPAGGVAATLDASGHFPTLLADTRVFFDGNPAPLIYVRSDQINSVAPFGLSGRTTTQVQIEYRGIRSGVVTIPVTKTGHPGIFTADASGRGQAAALNEDGSINAPSRPARPGSVIVLFATGGGPLDPIPEDGTIIQGPPPRTPILPAYIGFCQAEVLYSGSAPELIAGAIQVNLRVPEGAQCGSGNVPVYLFGGAAGGGAVTISVAR